MNKMLKILCYYIILDKKKGIISKALFIFKTSLIQVSFLSKRFLIFSNLTELLAFISTGHWELNGKTRCYSCYEGFEEIERERPFWNWGILALSFIRIKFIVIIFLEKNRRRASSVITIATILTAARDGSLIKPEISLCSFYIENVRKLGQISSDRRGITWDSRTDV